MPKIVKHENIDDVTETKVKKLTYSSVCKEYGLTPQELNDLLNQIYSELEKNGEVDDDNIENSDEVIRRVKKFYKFYKYLLNHQYLLICLLDINNAIY